MAIKLEETRKYYPNPGNSSEQQFLPEIENNLGPISLFLESQSLISPLADNLPSFFNHSLAGANRNSILGESAKPISSLEVTIALYNFYLASRLLTTELALRTNDYPEGSNHPTLKAAISSDVTVSGEITEVRDFSRQAGQVFNTLYLQYGYLASNPQRFHDEYASQLETEAVNGGVKAFDATLNVTHENLNSLGAGNDEELAILAISLARGEFSVRSNLMQSTGGLIRWGKPLDNIDKIIIFNNAEVTDFIRFAQVVSGIRPTSNGYDVDFNLTVGHGLALESSSLSALIRIGRIYRLPEIKREDASAYSQAVVSYVDTLSEYLGMERLNLLKDKQGECIGFHLPVDVYYDLTRVDPINLYKIEGFTKERRADLSQYLGLNSRGPNLDTLTKGTQLKSILGITKAHPIVEGVHYIIQPLLESNSGFAFHLPSLALDPSFFGTRLELLLLEGAIPEPLIPVRVYFAKKVSEINARLQGMGPEKQ